MSRFRNRKTLARGRVQAGAEGGRRRRQRAYNRRLWTRQQQAEWSALQGICSANSSEARLARLITRMTGADRGARESALAELELATLLIRAGFRVELLPESHARTADFHCWLGEAPMLVEVTAILGDTKRPVPISRRYRGSADDQEDDDDQHGVIARLLARVAQKARQLDSYAEPVVLAVTVPHADPKDDRGRPSSQELDLKRLAGSITLLLGRLRHLSAVLLSLWDVDPSPSRSGVRLANVHVVERSRLQRAYPRVRLLILNPAAGKPLHAGQIERLCGML